MSNYVYRAKGIYEGTGRPSWISTGWYKDKKDAMDSARIFGRHTNVQIMKLDYIKYANKKGHYPKILGGFYKDTWRYQR